jgi:hypothetical protein
LGSLASPLAAADFQKTPVLQWQEVRYRPLDDAQPMGGEIEVSNNLWVQQRDGVRCDRIKIAGAKLLRHSGAADDRTLFEERRKADGAALIS